MPTEPVLSVRLPFQPLSILQTSTTPMVTSRTNCYIKRVSWVLLDRNNNLVTSEARVRLW